MAYRLTWWIGRELKEHGITTEVETVLKRWDQLELSETTVETSKEKVTQWNWTLGEDGCRIKSEIEDVGIWRSLEAYKCSATKHAKVKT